MLSGPTVLVLGAGSSVDFGMPTGAQLVGEIRTLVSSFGGYGQGTPEGAEFFRQAANTLGNRIHAAAPAAGRLAELIGSFNSIDDCLYTHGDDELMMLVGKAAIARVIARREHSSGLINLLQGPQEKRSAAASKLSGGWADQLVRLLYTGVRNADRQSLFDDLTLVTFNYDRCAEVVLFHLVRQAFGSDDLATVPILDRLKVYRPYGGLGAAPWKPVNGSQFGSNHLDPMDIAKSIFVYTETLGNRPDLVEMRGKLENARNIVFLGFGFHSQNMDILNIPDKAGPPRQILATVFQEPEPRLWAFGNRVRRSFGQSVEPRFGGIGQKSADLMRDFGILLAR